LTTVVCMCTFWHIFQNTFISVLHSLHHTLGTRQCWHDSRETLLTWRPIDDAANTHTLFIVNGSTDSRSSHAVLMNVCRLCVAQNRVTINLRFVLSAHCVYTSCTRHRTSSDVAIRVCVHAHLLDNARMCRQAHGDNTLSIPVALSPDTPITVAHMLASARTHMNADHNHC
jgi:hypothetical protein